MSAEIHYRPHGGKHHVAIVHCPKICGDRLLHLSQDGPESWVLRDYVMGLQLSHAPAPAPSHSDCHLDAIELQVVWSEPPPYYAFHHLADWAVYLKLRTLAFHQREPLAIAPNSDFGTWVRLH